MSPIYYRRVSRLVTRLVSCLSWALITCPILLLLSFLVGFFFFFFFLIYFFYEPEILIREKTNYKGVGGVFHRPHDVRGVKTKTRL